jgi:hypothetical protein
VCRRSGDLGLRLLPARIVIPRRHSLPMTRTHSPSKPLIMRRPRIRSRSRPRLSTSSSCSTRFAQCHIGLAIRNVVTRTHCPTLSSKVPCGTRKR